MKERKMKIKTWKKKKASFLKHFRHCQGKATHKKLYIQLTCRMGGHSHYLSNYTADHTGLLW